MAQRYPCLCIFTTLFHKIEIRTWRVDFNHLRSEFWWSIVNFKNLVLLSNAGTFNLMINAWSPNSRYPCRVWSSRDLEEDQCFNLWLTILKLQIFRFCPKDSNDGLVVEIEFFYYSRSEFWLHMFLQLSFLSEIVCNKLYRNIKLYNLYKTLRFKR